jgi:UDP-N-acetylmuramate--alanine ligase
MEKVYFIGIGGIGMSALARYFLHKGCSVAGFDATPTMLTAALQCEGAEIHSKDNPALIPQAFTTPDTLVIYTPAVGENNAELQYFRDNGITPIKRSAALGHIAEDKTLIAVAGTHGKTTTSAMIAHILTVCQTNCTAFLGGIAKNYGSNLLLPPPNKSNGIMVAEADEYDRSFLQLFPDYAVITSMDADHMDIYGIFSKLRKAFQTFAHQIKTNGALICKHAIVNNFAALRGFGTFTYDIEDSAADFYALNITPKHDGCYDFDIATPFGVIKNCSVGTPGYVNVENAVAAMAAAIVYRPALLKIATPEGELLLKTALRAFSGVQRRMDVQINTRSTIYIDDYAHHPVELKAAIESVRKMFPDRRITGVFQPHLYTRTRDFAGDFAMSLSALDELILLPIYPARERPIAGVSSQMIFDGVTIQNKMLLSKNDVVEYLSRKRPDVLLTLGAGDIDTLVEPLKMMLQK